MSYFGSVCAVIVGFLELLLFLNSKAVELQNPAPLPRPPACFDFELICSVLCMVVSLAPMIHAVSGAVKKNIVWTMLNLVLSAATIYCSSVEFIEAFREVKMTDKYLPHPCFPVGVAIVVLIARIVQKSYAAEAPAVAPLREVTTER